MPLIRIKVVQGGLTEDKKKKMIQRVSEVVAEIEARPYPKEKVLPICWCIIEEVPAENWGGGRPGGRSRGTQEVAFQLNEEI
jgi:4-oxalocrotonate tautomerase family enzyme